METELEQPLATETTTDQSASVSVDEVDEPIRKKRKVAQPQTRTPISEIGTTEESDEEIEQKEPTEEKPATSDASMGDVEMENEVDQPRPVDPVPTSGSKSLRPKKDLASSSSKKKIAASQADLKNQPGIAGFFGGGKTGTTATSKASITSFFQKKTPATITPTTAPTTPTKSKPSPPSAEPTTTTFVDESGNITMDESKPESKEDVVMEQAKEEAAVTSTPSPKAKPTAAKRKREESEKEKEQAKPTESTEKAVITPKEAEKKVGTPKKEKVEKVEKTEKKATTAASAKETKSKAKSSTTTTSAKKKNTAEKDEDEEMTRSEPKPAGAEADGDDDEDFDDFLKEVTEEHIESEDVTGFDPVRSATWKFGEDVPFSALANVCEQLENVTGRLVGISRLANLFRSVIALTPSQLVTVVYLAVNQIAPAYEGERTNVGDSILMKSICLATGKKMEVVKSDTEKTGDLGVVAMTSRGSQKTLASMFGAKPKKTDKLTCQRVFDGYRTLADTTAKGMSGSGSQGKKQELIQSLLVAAEDAEAKFIVRGLQGNLRIHLAEKGAISALARAFTLTPPAPYGSNTLPPVLDVSKKVRGTALQELLLQNTQLLNQAYIEVPNHRVVIDTVLRYGLKSLPEKCVLQPGVPVKVMLGKPCNGVDAIIEKFGDLKFTLEYKYDGARAQIHFLDDGTFKIYSRNSQDDTEKYPDIIATLPQAFNTEVIKSVEIAEEMKVDETGASSSTSPAAASTSTPSAEPFTMRNFIIDCECVAWDRETKEILPFQQLTTRKKKDVAADKVTVQVCLFAFDLLYLNDVSYMNEPLITRRSILRSHFHEVDGQFRFAIGKDTSDIAEIQAFMAEATSIGKCEGLMIKGLEVDANYVPNKRNWFKLKKDYIAGMVDTLDLVVIGGWKGKGKRTGGYGAFLLATYDDETEEFQSICALGTGLSDEALDRFSQKHVEATDDQPEKQAYFEVLDAPPKYYKYSQAAKDVPDVFFKPTRIWEIKCADLSISPTHPAARGKVDESKGIALRFPRLEKERDDKTVPDDVTNADQVADFFNKQSNKQTNGGGKHY